MTRLQMQSGRLSQAAALVTGQAASSSLPLTVLRPTGLPWLPTRECRTTEAPIVCLLPQCTWLGIMRK